MAAVKAPRAAEAMHECRVAYPTCDAPPLQGALGGYIFVCNNETMDEDMKRDVFGEFCRFRWDLSSHLFKIRLPQ